MMSLVLMAALATGTEVADWGRSCGYASYSCGYGGYGGYSGYSYGGSCSSYSYCTPSYSYCTPSYSYCRSYSYCTPSYSYCTPSYSYCTPSYSYCSSPTYYSCPTVSYCNSYTPAVSYYCPPVCYPTYPSCGVPCMPPGKPEEKPKTDKPDKEEVRAPATLTVSLPADAKLTVDGAATKSTSSQRTFTTPELAPGKTFSYTLKAEYMKDGQMVSTEKVVYVQAGKETKVSFEGVTNVAAR